MAYCGRIRYLYDTSHALQKPKIDICNIHICIVNHNSIGGEGGEIQHATQKCPCSHNNNTVLIKQTPLFDTALS